VDDEAFARSVVGIGGQALDVLFESARLAGQVLRGYAYAGACGVGQVMIPVPVVGCATGMGGLYVTEEAMGLALRGTVVPALEATSAGTAATVARLLQNAGYSRSLQAAAAGQVARLPGLAFEAATFGSLFARAGGIPGAISRVRETFAPIWDVRASRGAAAAADVAGASPRDYGIGYRAPGGAVNDIPRGGAYRGLPRVRDHERHHMPANSVNGLSISRGPAIQMRIEDHARTSSYGNSHASRAYRERVRQLVEAGRMRDAMAMEIRDVRRISGSSYNNAIRDILAYAREQGLL
jgi:hypothetical protein